MLSYHTNRLPKKTTRIHNFGITLEPRWIVGTGRLDQ
jgi:hypothetical protein